MIGSFYVLQKRYPSSKEIQWIVGEDWTLNVSKGEE